MKGRDAHVRRSYIGPPPCRIDIRPNMRVFWFQRNEDNENRVLRGTVVKRWPSGRLVSIKRDDGVDVSIGDWILFEELA